MNKPLGNSYFSDFLGNINLPQETVDALKQAHKTISQQLYQDDDTKSLIVQTFLQGSYARSTIVKPKQGKKADVDVVVVTKIDSRETQAQDVYSTFYPFMERHYGKVSDEEDAIVRQQSRSIGISLDDVDLDFVPTAVPSTNVQRELSSVALDSSFEVATLSDELDSFFTSTLNSDWKKEPLLIPDYDKNTWEKTHPLEQIRTTVLKNKDCNGFFVQVVKAIKWWRQENLPEIKHFKGYPLERFVGECCPNGITSVQEGIVRTFENIILKPQKPILPDYGVPEHDVFEKLSDEEYQAFYDKVEELLPLAQKAYDSEDFAECIRTWKKFFADCPEFPSYDGPDTNSSDMNGYTQRKAPTTDIPTARFG